MVKLEYFMLSIWTMATPTEEWIMDKYYDTECIVSVNTFPE